MPRGHGDVGRREPGGRGRGGRRRPRDGLSLVGALPGRGVDRAPGAPVHPQPPAAAPEPRRRGGDPGRPPAQRGRARDAGGAPGAPRLDRGEGATAVGALAPAPPPAPPGRAL